MLRSALPMQISPCCPRQGYKRLICCQIFGLPADQELITDLVESAGWSYVVGARLAKRADSMTWNHRMIIVIELDVANDVLLNNR
jgi:hypothetical protein